MDSFDNQRSSTPTDFQENLSLDISQIQSPDLVQPVVPDLPLWVFLFAPALAALPIVGVNEPPFHEESLEQDSAIDCPLFFDSFSFEYSFTDDSVTFDDSESSSDEEVIQAPPAYFLPHPSQFFS